MSSRCGLAPVAIKTYRASSTSDPTSILPGFVKRATPWKVAIPDFWNACSCFCGAGSVKVLLKRIASAQSICAASLFKPFPFIRFTASMRAPTPTSTFFGSHPRSWQVPPNDRESLIATDQPALRHLKAAADSAAPVPITMRSNFCNYSPRLFLLWFCLGGEACIGCGLYEGFGVGLLVIEGDSGFFLLIRHLDFGYSADFV